MNFNQYLTIIDRLSMQQHGKRLAAIEREILGIAWEGGSYRQIESFQEQTVKNKAVKLGSIYPNYSIPKSISIIYDRY